MTTKLYKKKSHKLAKSDEEVKINKKNIMFYEKKVQNILQNWWTVYDKLVSEKLILRKNFQLIKNFISIQVSKLIF